MVRMLLAAALLWCSAAPIDPNDLIGNTPFCSANGRYCVVVRRYDIDDFTQKTAAEVFGIDAGDHADADAEAEPPPLPTVVPAALYEITSAGRKKLAELKLEWKSTGDVVVADSGRYLVALPPFTCMSSLIETDPMLTIYSSQGTRIGQVLASEMFTPLDLLALARNDGTYDFSLRHESDTREVAVFTVQAGKGADAPIHDIRVDLATAALLDPPRAMFPLPRAVVTTLDDAGAKRVLRPFPKDCNDDGAVRLESADLFSRVVFHPEIEFPIMMVKARIRGLMRVQVVVSPRGEVTCARSSQLPFEGDAAVTALRRWWFRPLMRDGHPVAMTGELLVRFTDVPPEEGR